MPVMKIDGSRSIAWQSPSDNACAYVILRIRDCVGSDMIEQGGDFRPGSGARPFDLRFDLRLRLVVPGREPRRRGDPEPGQALGTALDRAPRHPGFDLLARPVLAVELVIEIRTDMLAPPIGHALEKERAATSTHFADDRLG